MIGAVTVTCHGQLHAPLKVVDGEALTVDEPVHVHVEVCEYKSTSAQLDTERVSSPAYLQRVVGDEVFLTILFDVDVAMLDASRQRLGQIKPHGCPFIVLFT